MQTIVSSQNYELTYHEEHHVVMMKFKGDMTDDTYKEFWTKAIDFATEHQINRVIIDQQEIGNVSFNARGWVVVSAFPRAKKNLPKDLAAAVLSSGRIVQKAGMQYLLKAFVALTGYQVEIRPNLDEALAFLRKANKPEVKMA